MVKKIIETHRLYLRELVKEDFDNLCLLHQDEKAMYAFSHAFSDEEVYDVLKRQFERYEKYGFGYWAVIEKETEAFIGRSGIIYHDVEGEEVLELGYLLIRDF